MEKQFQKFDLFADLRDTGVHPVRSAAPLSLMLLWSQLPAVELQDLPELRGASAEFILNASSHISARLYPSGPLQNAGHWDGLRSGDVERMRRAVLDALDSGVAPDTIAEAILEYCAPSEWGSAEATDCLLAVLDAKEEARISAGLSFACRPAWTLAKRAKVDFNVENASLALVLAVLAKACQHSLRVRVSEIGTVIVPDERPDHALVIPPLGMRIRLERSTALPFDGMSDGSLSGEMLGTYWGASLGRQRNVVVVSNGLLFRTSSNDAAFKRELIHKHGLKAVVSLPRGLFPKTSIGLSALVFSGHHQSLEPRSTLRFINAGDPGALDARTISQLVMGKMKHPLCSDCPIQEVAGNGYNLSVDRYVLDRAAQRNRELLESQETIMLADLADIRRPQAFPRDLGSEKGVEVREAMLADIEDGRLSLPGKLSELPQLAATKIESAVLKPGDILLSIKGTIGKAALVTEGVIAESAGVPIVPGQSFVVIRLRKAGAIRDPEVLFSYLRSPVARSLLQGMAGGTTIANVAMGDLKALAVPVLPLRAQKQILEKFHALQELQMAIDEMKNRMKTTEDQLFSLALGQ